MFLRIHSWNQPHLSIEELALLRTRLPSSSVRVLTRV
jgi:hypothetical protein